MDGYVIIGTELDTKQLEQDLKNAKKELTQFQKEEERLLKEKGKVQLQLSAYDEEKAKIKANTDEMIKKAETETQVNNLLNMENIELDKLTQKYSKQFTSLDGINDKLKDNQLQQGLINGKIEEANTKLTQARGYENVKNQMGKISDKTSDVIKKVGKWALAIFSVRSAYMFVRQMSGTLAQYDEQYGANLEYIRYALAQGIAPVLRYLVDLAGKLLGYLNYILNAWFGINLFANATASSMNKGANATAKMKKQLAGFDEMNVLNDNGSVGAMGSVLPSMDLSQIQGDVPKWLEWIAGNGGLVREIILGIASALAGLKLAKVASGIGLIGEKWLWLRGLGIGVAIYGIIELVKDLTSYIDKFDESLENNGTTFEDFGKIVKDVGLIVLGIGTAFLNLPAVITGACIVIFGLIIKYRDQILNALETAYNWLTNMQENLVKWFIDNLDNIQEKFGIVGVGIVGIIIGVINTVIEAIKGAIEMVMHLIQGISTGFKQIFDGILMIFRGNFKQGFISIAKGIANIFIGIINAVISGINAMIYPIRSLVVQAGKIFGKGWDMNTIRIPTIRYLKNGGIINLPSHGVPLGANARGGEAGAEGVIPLTDSQAMETLGETIGRYITINANITNTMNGRVISRQLQQIMASQNFAYNS